MKKFILPLVVVCLFTIETTAQATFKPGIRGGANFSKLTQTDASYRTNFYISGFGEIKLGKFYTLQPEIGYSGQGAAEMELTYYDYETEQNVEVSEDISLDYISVGIINKLRFNEQFNFHLGPFIDVQTGKNRFSNSELDLSFTAGLGYNFTENLGLEARVKKGIIDVFDSYYDNSGGYYIGSYNTNFLFQIGLTYTFELQK